MTKSIVFIDSEVGVKDHKIKDLGAKKPNSRTYHSPMINGFFDFVSDCDFICGHNIIHHDLKYITPNLPKPISATVIDTLYLSPLLFPQRPYHRLVKDDKIQSDTLNNPLNDAEKAEQLFNDEVNAFYALTSKMKQVYCGLLYQFSEFKGFFDYVGFKPYKSNILKLIKKEYIGKICDNVDLEQLIKFYPRELAYALALIGAEDYHSITPPWLAKNYPRIDNVIKLLRNTPCKKGCVYCKNTLNIHLKLKKYFGYNDFRRFNGENLQEKAVQAAVDGKSLLAVFPTGGGKSLTFQLPALMAGENVHGLTVVISPLQSLMKDQVDNLNDRGLVDAVTINGLLNNIERAEALERVFNGLATILYISPEQLRSKTIERLLLTRTVVRFVIDEAHCFSAWGQDFRVDYLYIGDFIHELQIKKNLKEAIPVSCFTATAKQKVISDICDYFFKKLGVRLELYTSTADRENLVYTVLYKETEEEKYNTLRNLVMEKKCPTIVYVSRVKKAVLLADKLTSDGFLAKPFHGQMDANDKVKNQEAFLSNEVPIIVATSAFGMGVDKKDVLLVVHYDISNSLENYMQEAGRAGRNPNLQADCYVLFSDRDLDNHFLLLNQTKISISEIQQVFKAIKTMTKERHSVSCSPLEVVRQAGWGDTTNDIETRVKTAIAALETAGYIRRGQNIPRVFATSILVRSMGEASEQIDKSLKIDEAQKQACKRIIKSLISSKSIANNQDDAETRVDYIADMLGIDKESVIDAISLMRQEGLLADNMDMSAYISNTSTVSRTSQVLDQFAKLEEFLLSHFEEEGFKESYKEINEAALAASINTSTVKNIRTLIFFLTIKGYLVKPTKPASDEELLDYEENIRRYVLIPTMDLANILKKFQLRISICHFIIEYLFAKVLAKKDDNEIMRVDFSLVEVFTKYNNQNQLDLFDKATLNDVKDALLYLTKIGVLKLEGGFLVLYNAMEIKRLVYDNKIRYKTDDYKLLSEYYRQKIQQIHIVGEYANLMVRDYDAALEYVHDYFQMDYKRFVSKYFKGERIVEIERNITPGKYKLLFGELSKKQATICNDSESKYIIVAAGPGSGKTRVLVHKLASLLLLEDTKHEQLLMITFSRAAATEFKKRLISLIGSAANYVEIKTFHSYCFDLLGKIGSLESSVDVVKEAAEMIERGEVEQGRITKTVLVIDEAQDMDENEYRLIRSLMTVNDDMRVIAVGDDDQNIYEFRGADSRAMLSLQNDFQATKYEMTENYRSKKNIVYLANKFVGTISERMKETPIRSISKEDGVVEIYRYSNSNLAEPVVNQVITSYQKGKVCILTTTNDEALCVTGLLIKKGIRAKLIQSIEGFRLYNLAEIRFFLQMIDKDIKTPVIDSILWNKAKQKLRMFYADSSCLENCLNLISDFEKVNPNNKYRTDLEEFIKESNYEDFYSDERETIYVSTIHKAKGREFDSVYLLLDNYQISSDAAKRTLYVGLTRAKDNLYIHCNTNLFSDCIVDGIKQIEDSCEYSIPTEMTLQLTHRDVVLDFFKDKKEIILKLRSGMKLKVDGDYLTAEVDNRTVRVAKLSKSRLQQLAVLAEKSYILYEADIRFIVAWKNEDNVSETAVVLPNLYFKLEEKNEVED